MKRNTKIKPAPPPPKYTVEARKAVVQVEVDVLEDGVLVATRQVQKNLVEKEFITSVAEVASEARQTMLRELEKGDRSAKVK